MRKITLTTGYEVDLASSDGFEHLFNTVFGEVLARLKDTKEFSERGFALVYDVCICELHFIAGQLHNMQSTIDINMLLDEFSVHWDMIAKKINGEETG